MNEIIQKILDFPGEVTQRVLGQRVSKTLDSFNESRGIRGYFQLIYKWASLGMCVAMIWTLIDGVGDYFDSADKIEKMASVVTTAVCLLAAFVIPTVIRNRGNSFASSESGTARFLVHDVIITNIRLVGELTALVFVAQALCFIVATIFEVTVFAPLAGGGAVAAVLSSSVEMIPWPYEVFEILRTNLHLDAVWDTKISGEWTLESVMNGFRLLIDAVIALAVFHVLAAFYGLLYNIVAAVIHWIQHPHITIKNS